MILRQIRVSAFRSPIKKQQRWQQPALMARSTRLLSSSVVGTPETSFDDGKSPFQITTPIYYVNDKPHIGHAYTSIGT